MASPDLPFIGCWNFFFTQRISQFSRRVFNIFIYFIYFICVEMWLLKSDYYVYGKTSKLSDILMFFLKILHYM